MRRGGAGVSCQLMDVRCPRCSTEYELDETRVPDEGATVKCASCSFVFLVRKQVDEPTQAQPREWKVRQANGNVFTCHELTTLQRWIVEGKVSRDDDISLSGETWKRLGNIPELSSFFQVAEDAARGRAYEAMQTLVQVPAPPVAPPPAPPPAASPAVRTSPQFSLTKPPPPPAPSVPDPVQRSVVSQPSPVPAPVAPVDATPESKSIRETWKEPAFQGPINPDKDDTLPHHSLNSSVGDSPDPRPDLRQINIPAFKLNGPQGPKAEPAPLLTTFDEPDDDAMMKAAGGGSSKFGILVLLGVLLGAAAGYYFLFYVPEQEAQANANKASAVDAGEPVAEGVDAGAAPVAMVAPTVADTNDAGVSAPDAGAAVAPIQDAGAAAVVDAGKPVVDAGAPFTVVDAGAKAAAPVPVTYDALMRQADRLRDAEKAEAALSMYGRAADLEPNRIEPMAGRGLALLDMGQANAALGAFEQVLSRAPKYGPAVMGTAEAYRMLKNTPKAIEWYQRYLDELPEGSEANVARNNIERLKQ